MGNILVFLEQSSGKITKGSLAALTAAQELKNSWGKSALHAVCFGPSASQASEHALSFGVNEAYYSEDAELSNFRAGAYAAALSQAVSASSADALVGLSSTMGKDIFPRVAAMLDAGQASDIIAVNADGTLKRPMFAGDVFADVEITSVVKIVTVRGTAFQPAPSTSSSGSKKELNLNLTGSFGEAISFEASGGDRPELTEASIIVSGGRALKSSETFMQIMAPLADVLGAAIGASRAAVDSGYAPNDWQVGQTGKVVAPTLYIAVGISGAIQHLAGMKDSKTIVAINKDPEAPIFEVADYGLVADLFTAVPELVEELKKAK